MLKIDALRNDTDVDSALVRADADYLECYLMLGEVCIVGLC